MHAPVVIVGGGIAGLSTALAMAPRPVCLVCRGADGGGSATALAQGGIAAALAVDDSPEAHAADTLVAGARHNDPAVVRWLCAQAPATVAWLQDQGVVFDRKPDGSLQAGREGGHGRARIVHAGGDATGARVLEALLARVRRAPHVRWCGGQEVEALLLRDGRVCGVRTADASGQRRELAAAAVVLATGGIGALFARTSNPAGADGSGLALGLAAGARARDLEFVQFHPTALDVPDAERLPLITEALRGAGARLRDESGRLLMAGIHPQGDLAPRDVVARRVWQVRAEGRQTLLDGSGVAAAWKQHFPTVLAACLAHGIDPRRQPIPITPAAHFHMGGLAVDADGRTSVPGLYAVGEVACNGIHGANRLASNSLLEGATCGRRLGHLLASTAAATGAVVDAGCWVERGAGLPPTPLAQLRQLLWQQAGPVRDRQGLAAAIATTSRLAEAGWQARLARRLLEAAYRRRHGLGAHWMAAAVAC